MKAMILAAGLGLRLRPLTETTPKALVPIQGVPLLDIIIRRLVRAGVDGIIVNAFHLADQVEDFLQSRYWGVPVVVSREDELLSTGGGLKQACWFFDDRKPFFLHNGDVYSEVDLALMYRAHQKSGALASLAVSDRSTQRYFLFDDQDRLCGWESLKEDRTQWAGPPLAQARRLAFNGIAVLAPEFPSRISETGVFPITKTYLRLAAEGALLRAFRSDAYFCCDIGDDAKLERARRRADEAGLPA